MFQTIPGVEAPAAPWGQEAVLLSPDLAKRVPVCEPRRPEVCVVLGAGGALGPDLCHALKRTVAVVIGVDIHVTYTVEGVVYRRVDLCDPSSVSLFFEQLRSWSDARGLSMGTVYDLATIQTSPSGGADRGALVAGKQALVDVLCGGEGDAHLFFMSTAEVYGAPEGAPYSENSEKKPINVYGRHKLIEEEAMLSAHGRQTASGVLRVVALRTWTLAMVNHDTTGRVIATRNYNDPMVVLAEKLARSGMRLPVGDPEIFAQFHRSEEVAEVALLLGCQSQDASTWGEAFNCIGRRTTHGRMRDVCLSVFAVDEQGNSVALSWPGRLAASVEPLVQAAIKTSAMLCHRIRWLNDTRFGERLPFLYRSTDIDATRLTAALGDQLFCPQGTQSEQAVTVLCEGLRAGGPDALNLRRYRMY